MRKRVTGADPHEHARFRHYEVCMPVPVVVALNPASKISREGAQQRH